MNEQLNEQMPQSEAKLPITRKMCVQAVKQTYREMFPRFYWIGNAIMAVFVVAVACLLFIPPYWPVNLMGVVWLILNWCMGLGAFFFHVLALFGVCNVAKDVLRGKFVRKDTRGQVLYHWFRFTYHSPKPVDKHMYEVASAGEIFYTFSVPGLTYNETVAIYPISKYEWKGNPGKVKDYTRFYATQEQTQERVENTILARRPLTRGRKWKLTEEEIVRDLCENTVWTSERLGGITFGVLAVGALLFLASVKAALIALTVGCVICAALWIERGVWLRRVKAHRFVVSKDVLMDKDPVTRGILKRKTTRYLLSFRKGTYLLPLQDESVYHDAELGDTFYTVRVDGKNIHIRAVYNALDFEWYE
jgi:hypothetical protein